MLAICRCCVKDVLLLGKLKVKAPAMEDSGVNMIVISVVYN